MPIPTKWCKYTTRYNTASNNNLATMILIHWFSQTVLITHTGKPLVGISPIRMALRFSEIYPRPISDSNITEKNLIWLSGLRKNMTSGQLKGSLNRPSQKNNLVFRGWRSSNKHSCWKIHRASLVIGAY